MSLSMLLQPSSATDAVCSSAYDARTSVSSRSKRTSISAAMSRVRCDEESILEEILQLDMLELWSDTETADDESGRLSVVRSSSLRFPTLYAQTYRLH